MRILSVVGARPNFIKIAPILEELERARRAQPGLESMLVHTGQHYNEQMSTAFFSDLSIPAPDVYLGVGSGSHAEQTAKVMLAIEKVLLERKPDVVLVVGDVNSTLACGLTAAKLDIPVAHVEAGLRSGDRAMPEEINRILTDALSSYLFTSCEEANRNLRAEGIPEEKIHLVGNVMIDTLLKHRPRAAPPPFFQERGLKPKSYALLTLHRPANVDDQAVFGELLKGLEDIQESIPIIFPVHPRTRKRLSELGLDGRLAGMPGLIITEPCGYHQFLYLMDNARLVMTDSGGIQEETTVLGVPCLTLRDNTERHITIDEGTNELVGRDAGRLIRAARRILESRGQAARRPKFWDGQASRRIVAAILERQKNAMIHDVAVRPGG